MKSPYQIGESTRASTTHNAGTLSGLSGFEPIAECITVVITVYLKQAKGRGEGDGEGEREKEIRKSIACNFTECTYIVMVSL